MIHFINVESLYLKLNMFYRLYLFFVVLKVVELIEESDIQLDTVVQRKAPGVNSPKKLWWAKEITPDFHIAGRLSERQLKYATEGGFNSVVSLFTYEDTCDFGRENLPTTQEAFELATKLGLQYEAILGPWDEWASVKAVELLSQVLPKLKRPVLLHCDRGYTITFVTLMYMANLTRHDPTYTPKINSENFYNITAAMGLDFTMDNTKDVVSEITGEPVVEDPIKPNAEPEEWRDYWVAHSVYKNWYTAGQIRKAHLRVLRDAGFKSVVNMRLGMTHNGEKSQETVTLLNIKDGTPTYGDDKYGPRQDPETLKTLVLDPNKPNDYISEDSPVNYESKNAGEYGDAVGYNEELEKKSFKKSLKLDYYHMPIDPEGEFSAELFEQYKDKLLEIGKKGPVLLHCASGKRVAYIAVLAAALEHDKDLTWALKRIRELGFYVSDTHRKDVYDMYTAYLSNKSKKTPEHNEL
ncbi:hypothetical protein KUTeg_021195 [Tegillarca granosa]|uniref:Tyrosine specific protein phosphatases domain-containing protein n=1 Tax=Tegillarca granosa TaxID=220873 RepID=A0ABQ9EA32_TEGGR|nr:hypothetical protein KUTeg_021195 [Tegillarca granosa]